MPCYRCGVRQTDPARGHSPWQRGVRKDQQVLVCPDCQASSDWTADLDRCRNCGSIRLMRRLGEVECRECGFVVPPDGSFGGSLVPPDDSLGGSVPTAGAQVPGAGGEAPGLAEEVARALERVLGRASRKPPASAALQ